MRGDTARPSTVVGRSRIAPSFATTVLRSRRSMLAPDVFVTVIVDQMPSVPAV
jgi:hypothetical protein